MNALFTFVPWKERPQRQLSKCVKSELELLVDLLVRDFIMTWYKLISNDQIVPDQVAQSLHEVGHRAHTLFQQINQHDLLTDILLVARVHVSVHREAEAACMQDSSLSLSEEYARLCRKTFPNLPDKDTELDFLRQMADVMIELLLAGPDLQCEPARQVLREVLAVNVLDRLMTLLTTPDWVNQVLVTALSDTPRETVEAIRLLDESPAEEAQDNDTGSVDETVPDGRKSRSASASDSVTRRAGSFLSTAKVSGTPPGQSSTFSSQTAEMAPAKRVDTATHSSPSRRRRWRTNSSVDELKDDGSDSSALVSSVESVYVSVGEEVVGGVSGLPASVSGFDDKLTGRSVAMGVVGNYTAQSPSGPYVVYSIQVRTVKCYSTLVK